MLWRICRRLSRKSVIWNEPGFSLAVSRRSTLRVRRSAACPQTAGHSPAMWLRVEDNSRSVKVAHDRFFASSKGVNLIWYQAVRCAYEKRNVRGDTSGGCGTYPMGLGVGMECRMAHREQPSRRILRSQGLTILEHRFRRSSIMIAWKSPALSSALIRLRPLRRT